MIKPPTLLSVKGVRPDGQKFEITEERCNRKNAWVYLWCRDNEEKSDWYQRDSVLGWLNDEVHK